MKNGNRNKNNNKNFKKNGKSYNPKKNQTNVGMPTKEEEVRYRDRRQSTKIGEGRPNYDNICTNDITWYNKLKALFSEATKVNFNRLAGGPNGVDSILHGYAETFKATKPSFPGIVVFDYAPGIGIAKNSTDAPNKAFSSIYSEMVAKTTSGQLSFLPANLAAIVTAEQSIASNIAMVKRVMKLARQYTGENVYYPVGIIEALGFDPELQDHIADYTWRINAIVRDFNSMFTPNFIDVFKRHYFLSKSIFADGITAHAQLFAFRPDGYYIYSDKGLYNEEDEEWDGKARDMYYKFNWEEQTWTVPEMLDIIEDQIKALRHSSDWFNVNGTLLRTYSDSQFISISELGIDEHVEILHDPVMLYQIHNMSILFPTDGWFNYGDNPDYTPSVARVQRGNPYLDITTDPVQNIVIYEPRVTSQLVSNSACKTGKDKWILNTFEDSVSEDWIMESTRLIAHINSTPVTGAILDNAGKQDWIVESCGTEFVCGVHITTLCYDEDMKQYVSITSMSDCWNGVIDAAAVGTRALAFICDIAKFRYAPRFIVADGVDVVDVTGDIYLFTTLDRDSLNKLHTTALLSIYDSAIVAQK